MDIEHQNEKSEKYKDEPMYKADPDDQAPVSRRTVCVTVGILILICSALLVVLIMSLNGTIAPVNDVNYIRPAYVPDMDSYDVVKHTMLQCQDDMPITINSLTLGPHPLVVNEEVSITYNFSSAANVSEDLTVHLTVQRLEPPWRTLPCMHGVGSCDYDGEQACAMVATVLGNEDKKDCEIQKGSSTNVVKSLMVDGESAIGWLNKPGNYFVQAKVNYREQSFGCVEMSFRVVGK